MVKEENEREREGEKESRVKGQEGTRKEINVF